MGRRPAQLIRTKLGPQVGRGRDNAAALKPCRPAAPQVGLLQIRVAPAPFLDHWSSTFVISSHKRNIARKREYTVYKWRRINSPLWVTLVIPNARHKHDNQAPVFGRGGLPPSGVLPSAHSSRSCTPSQTKHFVPSLFLHQSQAPGCQTANARVWRVVTGAVSS